MRTTFRIAVRKFDPFESAIREQWRMFGERSGLAIDLEIDALELHPLYEALFDRGGLKDGHYDIAFINTDWIAKARTDAAVLDLSSRLRHDPPQDYPDGWACSLLRLQSSENTVLGLPYHDGPECLMVRKDLFANPEEQAQYAHRYGTALRIPRTWDEFHQVTRFFQRPEKGLYGTALAAFPDGHNTVYDFMLQLWTRNGSLFDEHGLIRFHTPQAVEALDFYRTLINDKTAIHPGSAQFDSVQSGMAFARGEIAIMVNWFGFAVFADGAADSRIRGCVDIAPLPHAAGGASASLNIYWLLTIAAGCPQPDLAYRFLRHCLTPEMDKLVAMRGAVGCRLSTWNDPEVRAAMPHFAVLERLHDNARELPSLVQWPAIAAIIDELIMGAAHTSDPVEQLLHTADEQMRVLR